MVLLVYQSWLLAVLVALILLPFILLFCAHNFGVYIYHTRGGISLITLAFLVALFFCFKYQPANAFIVMIQ